MYVTLLMLHCKNEPYDQHDRPLYKFDPQLTAVYRNNYLRILMLEDAQMVNLMQLSIGK